MDVTEAGIIEDGVNAKDNEVEMLEAGVNQQKVGDDDGDDDDDDGVMNDSENDMRALMRMTICQMMKTMRC